MDYKTKLCKINGVGEKTAEDIMEVYPTQDFLELAIFNKEKLPFDDDVVEKLEEKFISKKKPSNMKKYYVCVKTTGETLKIRRGFNPPISVVVTPEGIMTTKEAANFLLKAYPKRIIKGENK